MTRTRRFPPDPQSVSAARRFVTDTLSQISPDVRDAVELMVSELASNAVGHGRTSFEVRLTWTERQIRVEVTDDGGGAPVMGAPDPGDLRGRGLRIVDGLADGWGVEHRSPSGKVVWFTLSPAAPARYR